MKLPSLLALISFSAVSSSLFEERHLLCSDFFQSLSHHDDDDGPSRTCTNVVGHGYCTDADDFQFDFCVVDPRVHDCAAVASSDPQALAIELKSTRCYILYDTYYTLGKRPDQVCPSEYTGEAYFANRGAAAVVGVDDASGVQCIVCG